MLRFQAHWSQWKDSLHRSLGVLQEIHPDLATRFLMAVWRALYIFIDSACELWEIKTNNDFWYTTAFRESTEPNSDDIQENYLFPHMNCTVKKYILYTWEQQKLTYITSYELLYITAVVITPILMQLQWKVTLKIFSYYHHVKLLSRITKKITHIFPTTPIYLVIDIKVLSFHCYSL